MCAYKSIFKKIWYLGFLLMPLASPAQDTKLARENIERIFQSLRPADRKELADGYAAALSSSLPTSEKGRIDSLFKELQNIHVGVVPELKNYIMCVNSFCQRGEEDNLKVWLGGLERVLTESDKKRMAVKSYLENTVNPACEETIVNMGSHKWLVRGKLTWHAGNPISLDFENSTLVCTTKKDSISIYATSGKYLIGTDQFTGRGGMVKWREARDSIFADLSGYCIDLKTSGYTADSVLFHYESKYERPLSGRIRDNALKYTRGKDVPYPEFTSYSLDIQIRDMFEHVSFRGGIIYAGLKFSGVGTAEQPALIKIARNDTIAMKLYSVQFLVDSVRIMSGRASLEIAMDSGEITHPDINMLYTVPNRTTTIKRISEQSLHVPFKDSYHQVLFDMEEIVWPVDSNFMEMRMSSRSGLFKATIESLNFFNDNVYDNIQGLDEINPLNGLLKCSLQLKSNVFTIGDYAGFLKKPADQLRKQIVLLSYSDFVDFNESRDEVTLKQRLFDYTKCRVGKQDYDNIRFASHPKESRVNATLDVRNYTLRIKGVEKFPISEARNIYVEPSDQQVVMLKNRDMEFNGRLNAGMFDMFGQNLFFSYKDYKIKLPKVDSTSMFLAGQNKHLRGEKIKSLIRDITGEIVIDDPKNKSGKKEDPGFPVLNSTKESYVYFDNPAIQQGEYKRDSFYYKIEPYTIKGINDAGKFRYAFDGTLVSNIVAPIHDTLRLMKDNALGMSFQMPASGMELYGKGRIRSRITLDRNGFTANGEISLNHSNFRSDTILMLPQRMTAHTKEIKVDAVKEKRPEVQGKDVMVKYLPKSGNLLATSVSVPFDMYQGRIKHEGTIFVYEDLLDADGKLELEDATLKSKLFHLEAANILSKNTALSIASILNKDIRLNTSDVTAEINLLANTGKFVNNKESNRAEFVSSKYICSFESFTWYMKDSYLNIGIEDQAALEKIWKIEDLSKIPHQGMNRFISTDRLADSLSFIAPLARYDLKTGDIDCHWINHIDLANGRFYLEKGDMFIHSNGIIRELPGELLCDRTDTTRRISDVKLNLKGKNSFGGSGNYTYVSEEKKTSVLQFSEIGADTSKLIFAKALVKEEQPLFLNEGFRFKGNIVLHSRKPDLLFNGYVKMTTDTTFLKHSWLAAKHYLQSAHIRIPVEVENQNDKKQRVYNGIYLCTDKVFRPYGSFLSNRIFYNDDLLAGGKGYLEWKGALGLYVISDTLKDRYCRFSYDPERLRVDAFSKVNLDLKIPGMSQKVAGNISYNLKEEELKISDVLYAMDFQILPKMEGILLKDMGEKNTKSVAVPSGRQEKVYELFGKGSVILDNRQAKNLGVTDSLKQLLVLDSLSLEWKPKTRSYVSDGGVKVVAIGGKPVEKTMNIKMELLRGRSGNQFFMYIYNDQLWYYFEYADGSLYTLSSNPEYNDVVKLEKADKKIVRTAEKTELYTITLCPDSKKDRFLNRIK